MVVVEMKRFLSLFLIVLVFSTSMTACGGAGKTEKFLADSSALRARETKIDDDNSYGAYLRRYDSEESNAKSNIKLSVDYANKANEKFEWKFNVEERGLYYIVLQYVSHPVNGEDGTVVTFKLNEELPYNELKSVKLPDEYCDVFPLIQDKFGNDLRPEQTPAERLTENYLYDTSLSYTQPLSLYLTGNDISLELAIISGNAEIKAIILKPVNAVKTYEQVKEEYKQNGHTEVKSDLEIYQAENAVYKSSAMIYPVSDRSSSNTEPCSAGLVKLNSIGGSQWSSPGDYISWTVKVPEDGLYKLHLRAKQDTAVGAVSSRSLYINGELQFKEAQNITVEYNSNWQNVTLGNNEEDYLFYLNKGENEIRMIATLGDMDTVIRLIESTADSLNNIFRKFLIVMGADPDLLRDYRLGYLCPEEISSLKEQADTLTVCADWLEENSGSGNTTVALIRTLVRQLLAMNDDPDCIPSEFSYFKTNIGSLSSQCNSMKQQPLRIDAIGVGGNAKDMPAAKDNFFDGFLFGVNKLLYSFSADYQNMGDTGSNVANSNPIKVWIGGGREQAQIVRNMVANAFTPEKNILVEIQLVQASLISAEVAGVGPDVVINSSPDVFNFAMRNAAVPLSGFPDYSEIKKRFNDSLSIPFTYLGKVYALPETISFPVLYYRTDVFEELGLKIPETWDDVIALSSTLSKNNMEFGIPTDPGNMVTSNTGVLTLVGMYMSMYKQKGLEIYTADGKTCLLDSVDSIETFRFFSNLYTNYGFPLTYNFLNRFRTGEMPIGISGLSFYNEIGIAAPEIDGLWDIAQIPGTRREDGSINRTAISNASGAMILGSSKRKEDSWKFLKWWTSDDIQNKFAQEIEGLLGPSGRYSSANSEAFKYSSWPKKCKEIFSMQMRDLTAVENVPGSYFLSRNITNAFRAVVYKNVDPTDALYDYTYKINQELTQKRKEFNIE